MSVDVTVSGSGAVGVTISGGRGPQGPAGSGGAGGAVSSVQGRTGTVTLTATDLTAAATSHTHSTTDITLFTIAAAAAAPVQSVAGRTGAVVLVADDITAGTIDRGRLPVATTKANGVVQASSGLSVDGSGHLTANVRSVAGRTGDVTLSGGDVSGVVTGLNSLSGAVAIVAGSNITVASGGTTVSISSTGGGSPGGVTSVAAVTGSVTITAFGLSTSTSGQAVIIDARPVRATPAELSTSQNDYNPGAGDIFRIANGTTNTLDITGLSTAAMSLESLFINVSTHTSSSIRFRHQNTNSTAVNRVISPWAGDVLLPPNGGAAVVVYDPTDTRWRVT